MNDKFEDASGSLKFDDKKTREIKDLIRDQEIRNQNITYLVLFAFIAIVVTIAIEVSLFHSRPDSEFVTKDTYARDIDRFESQLREYSNVELDVVRIREQIQNLRSANPYLR